MNDPYQDVPPINVEPMLSDPEDVAPDAPSRGEPQLYYSSVHAFVDKFLMEGSGFFGPFVVRGLF